ncbi:Alw26I/Eco31I/Esp3I family type II restriction endonuclease [Halobacillus campisalis]|uniref:Alw26I/Eco31I/Esp3I family type II restriction endonuclease n=1 Tax=Halobacillus campisalis TaxID=435909 RepID=A0ABW2K0I9_9BACI|nr:Alw26I/Eco31I/Esp3I family type II restriction endonuclease [Halobacillus campisalis]
MSIKYGRGKFKAHQNYIDYMKMIVENDAYKDLPNARGENGRINWQVSSGKTTSFYEYYLARFDWWVEKANAIGLSGTGNSDDRFTIAARLIHPTGKRPCRLCGKDRFIGYMYLNFFLTNRWNKLSQTRKFEKGMDVLEASSLLINIIGGQAFIDEIKNIFPERESYFNLLPNYQTLFQRTQHIKSKYLSPGFMGNPPDRLDGFHDYGSVCCRRSNDPGRSDKNMRSYNHDRRAFKWWTEGDWIVADALYNSAGPGECYVENCDTTLEKVSPDHIGPLSCGFKQIPFFMPMCVEHNSAKNRRFTKEDVDKLLDYEYKNHESVASWQVRALWDNCKNHIHDDRTAKELSNLMRSLQDYYLVVLHRLYEEGMSLFLSYFLSPKNAYYSVEFKGLDPSRLTFESILKIENKTKNRESLSGRIVRIAFEELVNYNSKETDRKIRKIEEKHWNEDVNKILEMANKFKENEEIKKWDRVIRLKQLNTDDREQQILELISSENYEYLQSDFYELQEVLKSHFDNIGKEISVLL